MSNLPLNALRAFETAARLGSFSKAAEEMCVTQSAVSHQIKRLENWLGTRLFLRHNKGLELLPAGRELADTLTMSLGHIAQSCAKLRRDVRPLPVVVAAIPSIAAIWLVPRLDGFRKTHPDIDIRIEYALHGRPIDFSQVDFAFTFSDTAPVFEHASIQVYLSGACCAVCNPAVAEMPGLRALDPAALASVELLHDTDIPEWDAWFAATGLRPQDAQAGPTYHDFNLLRAAALAGQGLALCPASIIQSDLDSGRLVRLSKTLVAHEFSYYMSRSNIRRPADDPAASAFRHWALGLVPRG